MKHILPTIITSGPNEATLKAFGATKKSEPLSGGEGRVFQSGEYIFKHINKDSLEITNWVSNVFDDIQANGFRISKPIRAKNGFWLVENWAAWTRLEGNPSTMEDVPAIIPAITAFHASLQELPKPSFIDSENTPYRRADVFSWENAPSVIHPSLQKEVMDLYTLRRPLTSMTNQLIHGDINPENVLIHPGKSAAIIDLAPYWRPANFSLAIYAYWIGPWNNRPDLLNHFLHIPEFSQLLVRAAIRMLLIMSEFNQIFELNRYKKTTQIVKQFFTESEKEK